MCRCDTSKVTILVARAKTPYKRESLKGRFSKTIQSCNLEFCKSSLLTKVILGIFWAIFEMVTWEMLSKLVELTRNYPTCIIRLLKKITHLYILARQFLRKAINPPNLVVNNSWYLYKLSLGRLLEGDPLECCFLKVICHPEYPAYTLIWHYTIIKFVRFATLYSYLALYYY